MVKSPDIYSTGGEDFVIIFEAIHNPKRITKKVAIIGWLEMRSIIGFILYIIEIYYNLSWVFSV